MLYDEKEMCRKIGVEEYTSNARMMCDVNSEINYLNYT